MLRRALRPAQVRLYARSLSSVPLPSYTQSQTPSPAISPQAVLSDPAPQAPNHAAPWSTSQRLRPLPSELCFEQTAMDLQPAPLSAIELINNEPIRLVAGRRAVCDGGGGPLGHPKIFINLDKPGPRPCGYWQVGIHFEQDRNHHH